MDLRLNLRHLGLQAAVAVCLLGRLAAQEPAPDPKAKAAYALAQELQRQRLYDQAAAKWGDFLTTHSRDPRVTAARHALGVCLLQGGKHQEAITTLRAVLADTKFPALDAAHFNLALAQYNLGLASKKPDDLKAAAAAFTEVAGKFPQSKHAAPARYYQGECLYAAGDLAGAVAAYDTLIKSSPESPLLAGAHYALGTTLQELKEHAKAATVYGTFLGKWGQDERAGEVEVRLGQALLAQKSYPEAEKAFARAAQRKDFPLADYALVQQAESLQAEKKLPEAAALFEQVPKRFAKSTYAGVALLAAGKCWYRADRPAEARRALEGVLAGKSAEAPEAAYWLARLLLRENRAAEAVGRLDEAIRLYPRSEQMPRLVFTRIEALAAQPPRVAEAVGLYEKFAGEHAGHALAPRALYLAALTALQAGDHAAARRVAERFLADGKLAKHELLPAVLFLAGEACLGAASPDLAGAEKHFRRVLEAHPQHADAPRARLRTGYCRHLAGAHDEAVALLTEALKGLEAKELQAEAHLLVGRSHHAAGRTAESIAALEKALAVAPEWDRGDEARLALAVALVAGKKPDQAAEQLRRLTEEHPKSPLRPRALYQLGELALAQGQYEPARRYHGEVVSRYPGDDLVPLARYGIAAANFAEKQYDQAVAALAPLLQGKPPEEVAQKARYLRGLACQRLGQLEAAVKDLSAFLAGKPQGREAFDARHALALCQSGLKQYAPAATLLAALLREEPDHPRADSIAYELAFAHLGAGQEQEALAAFRALAERHPASPLAAESWFRIGEHHEKAGTLPEAVKAYRLAVERAKAPEMQEKSRYKVGWVLYQQKEYAEAARTLAAQLEAHPKGALALDAAYLAGECHFRGDQPAEALPFLERVVAAGEKKYLARALYRVGGCRALLEQWPAAQQAYATLIEKAPDFELIQEARYGLGRALASQDKLDEACALFEQVTRAVNTETAAKSRFMIGTCAFARKKYREAVEHFLAVAVGYPYPHWQALGYYEAGRCFISLADPERARANLEKVVQKYPDHACARDAARLLGDLR